MKTLQGKGAFHLQLSCLASTLHHIWVRKHVFCPKWNTFEKIFSIFSGKSSFSAVGWVAPNGSDLISLFSSRWGLGDPRWTRTSLGRRSCQSHVLGSLWDSGGPMITPCSVGGDGEAVGGGGWHDVPAPTPTPQPLASEFPFCSGSN